MSKTNLENFVEFLETHSENETGFVGVLVRLPQQPKPELIINLPEALATKINYFKFAYNPDLTLKNNHEVVIIKYAYAPEFYMLEQLFEEEEISE